MLMGKIFNLGSQNVYPHTSIPSKLRFNYMENPHIIAQSYYCLARDGI